ncbi:amidohydrolase family protein [Mesobacillus subterraneus]|uniref:adenine deaminase C-terminal domain-containing protein n=1 Tax=Mesobacillus subterraneus TaxID=285983 RepID=UPI00204266DB|nr:adenine deaminase C-terminal domain-containing protein [Mesobacillus subterraneus]MCM3667290.1 amidohydrolase family protein [Mesobacillus subterraneus]MCM3686297.1 amidohydrolase family protein [Mesobacillus subterraneus]
MEQRYRWKNKQLRDHAAVLDGTLSPTILLKNATYLNQTFRKWMTANIWIYKDRIVYVGENLPENTKQCETVDCTGLRLVPGYIEPHAHPFQLYNPHSFAAYASQTGTTTLINDNMVLALQLGRKKAFSFISELNNNPVTMYWWSRFDAQTEIQHEEDVFSNSNVRAWLEHESVVQGGELTCWPKLMNGDDMILHWMQETKRLHKKIEGHFPGASEKTLAKMMLFGADSDHEAMTGEEVRRRLMQGYMVSLRHSSIRPDLPKLLDEIHELDIAVYDRFMMTTDGASTAFYENGVIDELIRIAIYKGVPVIDAYNMATINVARYYNFEHLHGNIATGRIANINILSDEQNPTPVSVLAKGQWVKRDGEAIDAASELDWSQFGFDPLKLDWNLTMDDMQFSMPFGIKMENSVITKPYSISIDVSDDELSSSHDECFFMLIDRNGHWRINTVLKGFATELQGLASSFSNTGDIILIGKSKRDMIAAFNRMKELGGGIVACEDGQPVQEIPLRLQGIMSSHPMAELMAEEKLLLEYLKEKGYRFADPIYSLLFFSSTHLPYIRITQQGIYDVMKKTVLFPTIMR